MSFLADHSSKFVAGGVAIAVSAIGWLTRTVFTNNKKLELLQQKLDLELSSIHARQERAENTLTLIVQDHKETSQNLRDNTAAMLRIVEELKKNDS